MNIQEAFAIIANEMPYESGVINEALKTVENAVKKQIPKKPIKQEYDFFDFKLVCPECKNSIVNVWSKVEYKPNYCHYCGQALDWNSCL